MQCFYPRHPDPKTPKTRVNLPEKQAPACFGFKTTGELHAWLASPQFTEVYDPLREARTAGFSVNGKSDKSTWPKIEIFNSLNDLSSETLAHTTHPLDHRAAG